MDKPTSVEAYFASLEPSRRKELHALRAAIAAAVPDATEGITYGMPGFLVGGRGLVGYMGFERHYSLFPMSPAVIDAHRDELAHLVTGKGTISFGYGSRLPVALVKKVVTARYVELTGKQPARRSR
jgi:uncharacterized protein YdhG (YjbR/CyaY superfamily)